MSDRPSQTKTRLKAGCGLLLVFAAGFLCGIIALFVLLVRVIPLSEGWKADDSKQFIANHIAKRLDLSEAQEATIRPLIHEGLDERWRMRREYILRDRDFVENQMVEIETHLDDAQKKKIRRIFANWWNGKKNLVLPAEQEE